MPMMSLSPRERYRRALAFQDVDRLPVMEWAGWWDKTVTRWRGEGLPESLRTAREIRDYFGLDAHEQIWFGARAATCPPAPGRGQPIVRDRAEYLAIKPHLYPLASLDVARLGALGEEQRRGDAAFWITLEGFFWFPRTLLGIEEHLMAFFDCPELLKEMCQDLLEFNLRIVEEVCRYCSPDWMTFAEDMSYNHGPMLSPEQFEEFLAPYYRALSPVLKVRGIVPFVDTDGDVTVPIRWYTGTGIEGFLPLERMAGVDVGRIRAAHPRVKMIGAFDKTVMHLGEGRIRREMERLYPVMVQGGYIPSCDHQTPPEVSLQDYRLYVRLLREYCERAARERA